MFGFNSRPPAFVPRPPLVPDVYWFMADTDVSKDSSDRVFSWLDQTSNHFDVAPVSFLGVPLVEAYWPVWTPSVFPSGLAALDWGSLPLGDAGRILTNIQAGDVPTLPDEPVTVFALLKMNTRHGGRVVTHRRAGPCLTFEITDQEPSNIGVGVPVYAQDATFHLVTLNGGNYVPPPLGTPAAANTIDFTALPGIVMTWEFDGAGYVRAYVANVLVATYQYSNINGSTPGASLFTSPSGTSGFSIGTNETDGRVVSLNAKLGEIVCIRGNDATRRAQFNAYLTVRGGL